MAPGATASLVAEPLDAQGNIVRSSARPTWMSSDTSRVVVDTLGLVTAKVGPIPNGSPISVTGIVRIGSRVVSGHSRVWVIPRDT